jgi:hypothetical protein
MVELDLDPHTLQHFSVCLPGLEGQWNVLPFAVDHSNLALIMHQIATAGFP